VAPKSKSGMRTKKGTVTAKAREKAGMKGKRGKGKEPYPVFDQKSCVSAVKLRHHGKGISASAVLAKASAWASRNNNAACKAAVQRAREADRKRNRSSKGLRKK